MARAKYQVLVIPFLIENDNVKYCVFYRNDMDVWQFIAGGGEDEDETKLASAKREAFEEANIDKDSKYFSLDTQCSIPTYCFKEARKHWGEDCLVIPEYAFAVMLESDTVCLSHEHTEYVWLDYETAMGRLKYDSNRTALWELDNKVARGSLKRLF
ncbi:MAG: NUDIX hydrolase [Saccharofermentanales bacterium]